MDGFSPSSGEWEVKSWPLDIGCKKWAIFFTESIPNTNPNPKSIPNTASNPKSIPNTAPNPKSILNTALNPKFNPLHSPLLNSHFSPHCSPALL